MKLLSERDGLALGICNGFQALIKLGLVPYGEIVGQTEQSPTLTFNTIGRHISQMAYTRVTSTKSPWLAGTQAGDMFAVPISHGEGRFVADEATLRRLAENGQIVVAMIDEEATVKRFYKEHGHFRLQPENDAYAPIIVDELVVLGRVKFVIRQYY